MKRTTTTLLILTALLTGCQGSGPSGQQDQLTSLRCLYFRDQSPLTTEHLEYIRKQSRNGDLACKTILGQMNERGLGMPKDIVEAKAIYQSVADVSEAAYYQLGRMAEEGVGEPIDYARARQLYQRAANHGSTPAGVHLAALMESGKGGPQDLGGALTVYFGAIERYRDDAWKGVQRLRAKGFTLSAEQEKRYNEIWWRGFRRMFARDMQQLKRQLSEDIYLGSKARVAKVQFEFFPGSDAPKVSIVESSGDVIFDQKIISAASAYRILDEPILPVNQKSWALVSPLIFTPKEI